METSIIIPTKCTDSHVFRCLDSIFNKTDMANKEIVIVGDDLSDYNLSAFSAYHNVIITRPDVAGFSFSKFINWGVEKAEGKNIIILNDDIVVTTGWYDKLLGVLNAGYDLAAPLRLHGNFRNPQWVKPEEYNNQIEPLRFKASLLKEAITAVEQYVRLLEKGKIFNQQTMVPFSCVMMPKKIYEEVGGLDNDFVKGFYEDNLFCDILLHKLHKKIGTALDCVVYHLGSGTFLQFQNQDSLEKQAMANYEIYKNKVKMLLGK